MNKKIRILFMVLLPCFAHAQSNLDQVLASVQANNKTLLAEQRRIEAGKAFFQTGLALYDPEISLDWMQGFPSSAGSQTDLTAAQAFDFPTAYKYRRQVANLRTGQTAFESELVRKEILLEAKLVALRLIYLNKRKAELSKRRANTERFHANYQKKLEQQDATILDVNKARLQLLNIQTDLQLLETETAENLQRLTELNGGNPVVFTDTIYPIATALPDFETLEQTIEESDPALKYLQTQQQIGQAEARLTKALLLPKFEAGYRYQGLLGQQFHGAHAGVSVPLWENKKRLNYSALHVQVYDARIEEHRTEHYHEIKRLYEQYQALRQSFDEYGSNLQAASSGSLLDQALQAGQITVLEYFLETTLYFESVDRWLELEEAWQRAGAELLKYNL
ncbi:MAG: TolC family protein [Bacteroidetes bacterium]|nr:TolC family protein [Bacteroidota bacterium]